MLIKNDSVSIRYEQRNQQGARFHPKKKYEEYFIRQKHLLCRMPKQVHGKMNVF